MREYEIWHDEYKWDDTTNEYWHGIFFVPVDKKDEIILKLWEIKTKHNTSKNSDVKFAGSLQNPNKISSKIVRNNISLFSHLLITKESQAQTDIHHWTGRDRYEQNYKAFISLEGLFGCKFALIHIPDNHEWLTQYPMSYADRVETTFRMWFKGASHLMFSSDEAIIVKKFYFDWNEHHWRNIDINRIIRWEFREYCNICENCSIDDRWMQEREDDTKIMLSFVDNVVWGLSSILKNKSDSWNILYWIRWIYDRLKENKILKNPNGRWYKSINVSKITVKDNNITFPWFFETTNQMNLFDM